MASEAERSSTVDILLVEDDNTVAEVVSDYLTHAGYTVRHVTDGLAAKAAFDAEAPSLVVLDRMLPGLDGVDVCRHIRAVSAVPVIMLTALDDSDDRILGLEVGADDYLTKPFSPRELVLRVQSVLRRSARRAEPAPVIIAGTFAVDPAARTARHAGTELALTIREFDLLVFLLRNPGQVHSREELLRTVWGWRFGDLSTVTVHVRRLREKIERDPANPRYLTTVWGVGYCFTPVIPEEGS